jgi:hypothetical protein
MHLTLLILSAHFSFISCIGSGTFIWNVREEIRAFHNSVTYEVRPLKSAIDYYHRLQHKQMCRSGVVIACYAIVLGIFSWQPHTLGFTICTVIATLTYLGTYIACIHRNLYTQDYFLLWHLSPSAQPEQP